VSDELRRRLDELGPFFQVITVDGIPTRTDWTHPIPVWQRLERILGDVSGHRALDVGCNAGFFSFELARRGARVLGIDSNQARQHAERHGVFDVAGSDYPDWIEQALFLESRLGTGAEFRRVDVMDHNDGPYDTVLFLGVYYHLPDPEATVAHLSELVVPGGHLYIETQATNSGPRHYGPGNPYRGDPSVYEIPSPNSLTALLEAHGFRIVFDDGIDRERWLCKAIRV